MSLRAREEPPGEPFAFVSVWRVATLERSSREPLVSLVLSQGELTAGD